MFSERWVQLCSPSSAEVFCLIVLSPWRPGVILPSQAPCCWCSLAHAALSSSWWSCTPTMYTPMCSRLQAVVVHVLRRMQRWVSKITITIGHVILAAITKTTILVPYLQVKSLQLMWRSGNRRWKLCVPDFQVASHCDLREDRSTVDEICGLRSSNEFQRLE